MNTAQLFREVGIDKDDRADLHITRVLHGFVVVPYGASEMMMFAMKTAIAEARLPVRSRKEPRPLTE